MEGAILVLQGNLISLVVHVYLGNVMGVPMGMVLHTVVNVFINL